MFILKGIPLLTQKESVLLLFGDGEDNEPYDMGFAYKPDFEPLPYDKSDSDDSQKLQYFFKDLPEDWYLTKLTLYSEKGLHPRICSDMFSDFGLLLSSSCDYEIKGSGFGCVYKFEHVFRMIDGYPHESIKISFQK